MKETIIINFAKFPFCFRTATTRDFTNKLKDEKQFADKFKDLLEKLLPHVYQKTFEEYMSNDYHCHIIGKKDNDKIERINRVVSELVKNWNPGINADDFIKQNLEGEVLWQLGIGSIRLIGIRRKNILDVLFIDYHHLIYPSVKYNDKEYSRNNFGIIECTEEEYE